MAISSFRPGIHPFLSQHAVARGRLSERSSREKQNAKQFFMGRAYTLSTFNKQKAAPGNLCQLLIQVRSMRIV
jgi:hypothetical protein